MRTIQLNDPYHKGRRLVRLIETDLRDRKGVISRLRVIRDYYHGSQDRILDYDGQPDVHLNVITDKIEAVTPKLVNSFWNADPIVHVRRVAEEFDPDLTSLNELYMNWALESDIDNFYHTTEQWFRNVPLDGTSTVMTWWNHETRMTTLIYPMKLYWRGGQQDLSGTVTAEDRPKVAEDILIEIFQLPQGIAEDGLLDVRPIEDGAVDAADDVDIFNSSYTVRFIEGREEFQATVEFHPSRYIDEVDVYVHRPIVVANKPVVEVVEFEDLIIPFRTSDIQKSSRVSRQYWVTWEEINKFVDSGEWDLTEIEMERLEAELTGEREEQHEENRAMKISKDRQTGEYDSGTHVSITSKAVSDEVDVFDGKLMPEPFVDNRVLVFEVFCRDDVGDGTGEVIYQIPYCLKKVVKAEYLEERFPHGRRPFASLHCIKMSDRWYGVSWGQLLLPINIEVNAIVNMVNEAQELINNPMGFYVPHANTVDPEIISNIQPGQLIPVADINAVSFPQFPQQPLANLQEMDTLLLFADRLTMAPQSSGSSQVRNNPRTARAQLALLSEAGIKTDMMVTGFQKGGWKELMHQLHALYQHFGPDEKYFYVTGTDKQEKISQTQIRGRYEYSFSGNTTNTNREVQRVMVMQLAGLVLNDPMLGMDMNARQDLIKALYQLFGEGLKLRIPKLPGMGATNRLPATQHEELRMMQSGIPVDVLPTDNDAEHLDVIQKFMNSSEIEKWEEWQVGLIAAHAIQHQNQLILKQAQGAVDSGSMANNIPATTLGDLEGGVQ